jgi:hypothetical protein
MMTAIDHIAECGASNGDVSLVFIFAILRGICGEIVRDERKLGYLEEKGSRLCG